MGFNELNLHADINKALNICGYQKPTPIQAKTIPLILAGNDLIASAQTGTGKTAAFVLPMLNRLNSLSPVKATRILILTPTRELANQITKAASIYGRFLRFKIISIVGGVSYHHQIKDLTRGADIIVATPGRLLDHINQKRVDLSRIEMFVIDEADRMFDMGFIEDVEQIASLTKVERQTLLFSATIDKRLLRKMNHLLKNPVRIDLSPEKIAPHKIIQEFYKVQSPQQKLTLLKQFLNEKNIYKAIIFSATKRNADHLANELEAQGFSTAALHGDMKQSARNRAILQLRQGKIQFLVATDVAARGIDILDLTHVINYDLPKFCEDYVHRIGRTGRAGKEGTAISFVLPSDTRHLRNIEHYLGQKVKLMSFNNEHETDTSKKHKQKQHSYSERHDDYSSARKNERSFESKKDRRDFRSNYKNKNESFSDRKRKGKDFSSDRKNDQTFEQRKGRKDYSSDRKSDHAFEQRKSHKDYSADRKNDQTFEQRKGRRDFSSDRKSDGAFEQRKGRKSAHSFEQRKGRKSAHSFEQRKGRKDYSTDRKSDGAFEQRKGRKSAHSFEQRKGRKDYSADRKSDHSFGHKNDSSRQSARAPQHRSDEHSQRDIRATEPSTKFHKKKTKNTADNGNENRFRKTHKPKKSFKFMKDKRTMVYSPSSS